MPAPRRDSAPGSPSTQVEDYLSTLDRDQMAELVLELAAVTEAGSRMLGARAAIAAGSDEQVAAELVSEATALLRISGFVDYRRSFHVANDADGFLDELERELEAGGADVVAPALLKMTTRLRAITERADDSSGVIGGAGQRAVDLYARACREGNPDGPKLARWLVKFRDTSPGWPEVSLAEFAPALGESGLKAYRKAVDGVEKSIPESDTSPYGRRYALREMRLELADHDDDVDRAVEILASGEVPDYVGIIDRLRSADREREAMEWLDQARTAGRINSRFTSQGRRSSWVPAEEAVDMFLANGRREDALDLVRDLFRKSPTATDYDVLLATGRRLECVQELRRWAWEHIEAQQWPSGDVAITLALHEGDVDRAWEYADRWGVGYVGDQLADAQPRVRPADSLALHRSLLDRDLGTVGKKGARQVVARLGRMREMAREEELLGDFNRIVSELREDYRRRPTLIAELDRAGMHGEGG